MTESPRPIRSIDFIDAPLRGAPLVVLFVLMAAGGGIVAGSATENTAWTLGLLILFLATMVVSPAWMRTLAERSWPETPPRPRWFEAAVRVIGGLLLVGVGLAAFSSSDEVAWILFGVQCVFTAVVTPIELHRYPGVFPRIRREE